MGNLCLIIVVQISASKNWKKKVKNLQKIKEQSQQILEPLFATKHLKSVRNQTSSIKELTSQTKNYNNKRLKWAELLLIIL